MISVSATEAMYATTVCKPSPLLVDVDDNDDDDVCVSADMRSADITTDVV